MLIIFYGTLVGWSSSLYLNNDITANSSFPALPLTHIFPPDLWWWCLNCLHFPFKPLFSFSRCSWLGACVQYTQFVFPAATSAVGAGMEQKNLPELLPKSRRREHKILGNIYRSFSWKHQCQTVTILFSCFTFVLLSQNKLILNGMFSFQGKKGENRAALCEVLFLVLPLQNDW